MKKYLSLLLAMVLMLLLVGCSSSSSSSTDTSADNAEKDLTSMVDDVKTKIKDGADDVTADVKDALDTDSDLAGTWEAKDATVSDDQKGDYKLVLDENGTDYTEDISYIKDGTASTTPDESFKGKYLVKDNAIALLPEEGTVDGKTLTGSDLYDTEDYGRTYDYEVDGDKLTLTNPDTKEVIEFTKAS